MRAPRPPQRVRGAAVLLTLVALAGCAASPTADRVVTVSSNDKRVPASDAALASLTDPERPGCSAAVAVHGVVRWAGAAGLADLATGAPLTIETRFDLASVSKQFTATAVLLLHREGLLELSDPVSRYVDGLPAWGDAVTLDALLHHTSGVREYWPVLEEDGRAFGDPVSQAEIVRAIARQSTLEPGSGYRYSNSGYVLLAEVVRRVSGLALPDFLAERVFGPLDLDLVLAPNLAAADVAPSYDDDDARVTAGWAVLGPSEVFGTASELARWADQYRTPGRFVDPDFATGAVDNGEGGRYAAGINIESDGSLRHDGRMGGYLSTFRVSADRETAIVVLCNGHTADRSGIADALTAIWETDAVSR